MSVSDPKGSAGVDHKANAALEYLQVRGYYSTAYSELVQPERIFAITDYFRRYWVPLLKPGPAWLVVALRQHCYWNSQRSWCTVGRQTLADECGLAIRTVDNYIDSTTSHLVDWFVTGRQARYTTRDTANPKGARAKQRDWTRYTLRLDEPLTPPHQAALGALATELAHDCPPGAVTDRALAVAQKLLEMDVETLRQRLDDPLERRAARTETLEHSHPKTIQDIIVQAAAEVPATMPAPSTTLPLPEPAALQPSLVTACDALYQRIVRPDKVYIATQYFRLRWLPLLGPARAWLILHLRARCYLNPRQLEVRDTCTVGGLGELASVLGASISTVKTCLAEPPAATFLAHLATHRPASGAVEMVFRVEMIDPLTPADRATTKSPSSQQPDIAVSSSDQQPENAEASPRQQPGSAGMPGQQPEFTVRGGEQKAENAGICPPTNGQNLQNTKIQKTISGTSTQQQQILVRSDNDLLPLAAAAGTLEMILDDLKISEPAKSHILDLAPPNSTVIAWALEALLQERITNKPGFIVTMLNASLAPPPDLTALVELSLGRWQALARSCQLAQAAGPTASPDATDPYFQAVYSRLGHLSVRDWPIQLPVAPEPPGLAAAIEPVIPQVSPDPPREDILWSAVLEQLQWRVARTTFDAYLRDTRLLAADNIDWIVAVPTGLACDWLRGPLAEAVEKVAGRIAGRPVAVEFVVRSQSSGS